MTGIKGTTQIFGILGYPVGHSISPLMHNRAFELAGLDMCYIPFEVDPAQLDHAIGSLAVLGVKGVNVTIPFKEDVLPHCQKLGESARILGAVNTISLRDHTVYGDNTDCDGFINAWREEVQSPLEGTRVIIFGAGGSAKAVYYALAREKVKKITLFTRDLTKAHRIYNHFSAMFPELQEETGSLSDEEMLQQSLCDCDVIINCTPVGMWPHTDEAPAVLPQQMKPSTLLYDLVYNPAETLLLREGRARSLRIYNGLGMLLHQGALSFEIWTGMRFPLQEVRNFLKENLDL